MERDYQKELILAPGERVTPRDFLLHPEPRF
jgi:hypothetical protein